MDPLAEKYYNVSTYTFTGNYGFNVREVNGGLFIFVNGFDPLEYGIHLTKYPLSFINFLAGDLTYIPKREFKNSDSYGWGKIDDLYKEKYKDKEDENSLYIDGSMGVSYSASVRYNIGIKSGMELIKKIRSGEYKLEEDETIKIIGYSMGGAYAAGMAYALMQDPEYAHLLQFVDYLAPYQPKGFSHPNGVLGRQFVSSRDWIASNFKIENVTLKDGNFGIIGHCFEDGLYDFLLDYLNSGGKITVIQ